MIREDWNKMPNKLKQTMLKVMDIAAMGLIGIGISEAIIAFANPILHALTGQENINAVLPFFAALILILLSVVLTLIGGIIPSRKAAKSDPVAALRSE